MWDSGSEWLEQRIERIQKRKSMRLLVISLGATVFTVYLLFGVIFGISVVQGDSMEPALYNGDVVIFLRIANGYTRDDMVVVDTNHGKAIKRIVALPGETVEVDGGLRINGAAIQEDKIWEETTPKAGCEYPLTLGEKEYFVLGDHRSNSVDSRNYGPVEESALCGKVLCTIGIEI